MARSNALIAFICALVFLVLWPLTVQKPGLPYSMKADEPGYYLIARSLWEDRDLLCEPKDLLRTSDDYFYRVENLILGTRDGWETAFFAKPYFTSLLASPFVAAFGANGYVSFNMLLFMLSVWMGAVFLSRQNGLALGLLFSGLYFLLSAAFQYVFWLQPENATLFFVTLAYFFTFHEFDPAESGLARLAHRSRWWMVGLAAGAVMTTKPPYALIFLPSVVAVLQRRSGKSLLTLAIATLISTGGITLGQKGLTDTWSPYLGALRRGFNVDNPTVMPIAKARAEFLAASREETQRIPNAADPQVVWARRAIRGNDWSWIFAMPTVPIERIPIDLTTFLIGRHTGCLVYFPFAGVALFLMFSGGGARDLRRWAIVVGVAGVCAFLLLWNYSNYHGGGGFVGNRYLAPLYGAGLFLVHRIRPRASLIVGATLAALFLGQIVFAPLGTPVDEPTLQAYTRAIPFRWLPFEINLLANVPGQRGVAQSGAWIIGRKDRMAVRADWISILGAAPVELWAKRAGATSSAVFLLRSFAPGNVVKMSFGGSHSVVTFPVEPPNPEGFTAMVDLDVGAPNRQFRLHPHEPSEWYWRWVIDPRRAARGSWYGGTDSGLVGVDVIYLGERERIALDVYGVEWLKVEAPEVVNVGEEFVVYAELVNRSTVAWDQSSPAQVRIGYRWHGPDGAVVGSLAVHTPINAELTPGAATEVAVKVIAPSTAGDLVLSLEPIYEYVRWFGDVKPELRYPIKVTVKPVPPPPTP